MPALPMWDNTFSSKPYEVSADPFNSVAMGDDGQAANFQQYQRDLIRRRDMMQGRKLFDPRQVDQDRSQQMQFMDYLANRATGNASGPAQQEYRNNLERARAAVASEFASTTRGVNAGLAQRARANALSNMSLQANGQAATLAAQERDSALQALQGGYYNMRNQDYMTQQMSLNQAAQNDRSAQFYDTLRFNSDEAQRNAAMQAEFLKAQQYSNSQQINAGVAQQNSQNAYDLFKKIYGGMFSAAGSAAAMSAA